jgi:hypothetical protein
MQMHQNTFGLFVVCARADTHCTLVGAFFFLNAVSFEFELAGGGWELDGTWLGAAAS